MKSRPLLVWVLTTVLLLNTGANIFVLATLSKAYSTDDFRPDTISRQVLVKLAADKIDLPPIKLIKFISAYVYSKPCQVLFTGQDLVIFVNLALVSQLTDVQFRALITHEIGHYLKGHLIINPYPHFEDGDSNFKKEKEVDLFAAKYEGKEAVRGIIEQFVWDPDEKSMRLKALN